MKKGDVVRKISGGPKMTVHLIHDIEGEQAAACLWFEGATLYRDIFAVSELMPFPMEFTPKVVGKDK
jgi:uncharacterized protein YodC (DUF2158 family)